MIERAKPDLTRIPDLAALDFPTMVVASILLVAIAVVLTEGIYFAWRMLRPRNDELDEADE